MTEYIEREAAFNAILNLVPKVDDDGYCWVIRGDAARAIDSIPAADVRPVVRGRWVYEHDYYGSRYRCSSCGYTIHPVDESGARYCPNCGARMEES